MSSGEQYHFSTENIQPYSPQQNFYQSDEDIYFNELKDCLNYVLAKETIADFFPNIFNELHEPQDVILDLMELLNVPLIGNLTNDINFVIKALKDNKKYTIDEENKKLKIQMNDRTTIMLRDIPEDTPQEEIKSLFGEYATHITNLQPEIGNNYYVNFSTVEITQEAFNLVRTKTFNNKTVGCCIKPNFTFKSNLPYVYVPPEYQENPYKFNNDYKDGKKKYPRKRKDFRKGGSNPNSNGRGGGRPRGKKRDFQSEQIQEVGEYWPPLPNPRNESKISDLKKYTREQIVSVVDSLKDVQPPAWENGCVGISDQINTELEIGKVLPSSYKNEWIEKVRGKKKKNHRGRSSSGKKDESHTNQEVTPSVPVWPGRHKHKKEYVIKQTNNQPENETQETSKEQTTKQDETKKDTVSPQINQNEITN